VTTEYFDAIVIGAGEAGAVVASRAVAAGHRVAMIYHEPYGSTCVNVGCVPSKFLIHRANVAHGVRTAGRFDVDGHGEPVVDLAAMVEDKNALVGEHRAEALGNARRADGLTLIEGEPRFVSPRELEVGERRLAAERIFIATGMRPLVPDLPGIEDIEVHTNETIMDLSAVPGAPRRPGRRVHRLRARPGLPTLRCAGHDHPRPGAAVRRRGARRQPAAGARPRRRRHRARHRSPGGPRRGGR